MSRTCIALETIAVSIIMAVLVLVIALQAPPTRAASLGGYYTPPTGLTIQPSGFVSYVGPVRHLTQHPYRTQHRSYRVIR